MMTRPLAVIKIITTMVTLHSLIPLIDLELCWAFCVSSSENGECTSSPSIYSPKKNGMLHVRMNLECEYEPSAMALHVVLDEQFILDPDQDGSYILVHVNQDSLAVGKHTITVETKPLNNSVFGSGTDICNCHPESTKHTITIFVIEASIQWDLLVTSEIDSTWQSNLTCSVGFSDPWMKGVLIELQDNNITVAFCKLFSEQQAQGSEFVVQRFTSGCTFSAAEAVGKYRCVLSVLSHGDEILVLESDTIHVTTFSSSTTVAVVVPVVCAFVVVLALAIGTVLCVKKYKNGRSVSYRFREVNNNCTQEKQMEIYNEIICNGIANPVASHQLNTSRMDTLASEISQNSRINTLVQSHDSNTSNI